MGYGERLTYLLVAETTTKTGQILDPMHGVGVLLMEETTATKIYRGGFIRHVGPEHDKMTGEHARIFPD